MTPTHASDLPLHKQVASLVRGWISEGKYSQGDQLPSAQEIAELSGIKEQTVRRALTRLIKLGELRGVQGKGVFVMSTQVKHHRVALVLPNLEDEFTLAIARGVQDILDASGMQTLILDAKRDSDKEATSISNLANLPVDGSIVFPVIYGSIAEHIIRLKVSSRPFVLVDKHIPGVSTNCVVADSYGGAYELVTKLTDIGYSRFAWIGGEEGSSTVEEHLEGFRWALGDKGIAVGRSNVIRLGLATPTADNRRRIEEVIDLLLAASPKKRPEVLVCANDVIALEVLGVLQRREISVPDDIAVTGFDDSRSAAAASLTSVRKHPYDMGCKAAEMLLDRLTGKTAQIENIVLPTTPVFRKSTKTSG